MRVRSDLKFGTITDNPLAIGGTSVNSAQFATLPTIAGGDELYITLDPEGSNREIVKVTAHSAAATVVTVERGQLGTAAAQHALGTRWVHGIISTDLVVPCTSATRPTLGLWAGMQIFETDTNLPRVYDGSAWVSMPTAPQKTAANSAQMHWAVFSGTTDASGFLTVTHGAGFTPAGVMIQPVSPLTGTVFDMARVDTITSTTFRVRALQHDGVTVNSTSISGLFLCLA